MGPLLWSSWCPLLIIVNDGRELHSHSRRTDVQQVDTWDTIFPSLSRDKQVKINGDLTIMRTWCVPTADKKRKEKKRKLDEIREK